MAKLKDIKGTNVQSVDADPSNPVDGQLWYNSLAKVLKGEVFADAAWATGGNLNTARNEGGGAGDNTNALAFGGYTPTVSSATENYDGTSWSTSSATLSTARGGLAYSNQSPSSAALAFGGYNGTVRTTVTEEYNKSATVITAGAWSSGSNLPSARSGVASAGVQTAALSMAGNPTSTATEEYDGSAWSGGGTLSVASPTANNGGFGIQTAATITARYPTTTATENYDGTTWTTSGALGTGRYAVASAGTQTAGLIAGGNPSPANKSKTEEYDGTSWTAGGNLNRDQVYFAGAGTQTAAVVFGGQIEPNPGFSKQTEEYNGTSWTVVNNMGTATYQNAGGGIQTLAISIAGRNPSVINNVEQYDGTTWITQPGLSTARRQLGGTGPGSAGLAFGGDIPGSTAATEEFTGETSAANIVEITTS